MGCAHSPKSRPHAWAHSKVLWAQWSVVLYLPLSSGNKAKHFLCPTWNTQGNLQRVCCYKLTSWLTSLLRILLFSCAQHVCLEWKVWVHSPHLYCCSIFWIYAHFKARQLKVFCMSLMRAADKQEKWQYQVAFFLWHLLSWSCDLVKDKALKQMG